MNEQRNKGKIKKLKESQMREVKRRREEVKPESKPTTKEKYVNEIKQKY